LLGKTAKAMFKKTTHAVANKYALIYKKIKFDLAEMNMSK